MFKIKLEIDNKTYLLDNCHYSQYSNPEQTDTAEADRVNISFSIRTERLTQDLINWCEKGVKQRKNGKITIFEQEFEKLVQSLTFQQGYCSSMSTGLYYTDDLKNYIMTFSINAKTFSIKLPQGEGTNAPPDKE